MLSPLTKGYGTWTGNVNPYDDDGEDSDTSLPESEVPHRHGITVGFVSRTPSATAISPAYRQSSGHARPISSRDGARSARRSGSAREPRNVPSSPGPLRREQTDSQISLSKTYTTKKGALMLFSATEEELEMYSKPSSKYRVKFNKKPVDLIDTSLRLGTLDKLVMSVLKFGEDELEADGSTKGSIKEEKEKLFMKFLNRIDEMDVDIRSKPGGEMKEYMRDLKKTTSVKLGLTGETSLPHDKDAMELRAILRGLQNNRWPFIYKPDADQPDFSQPSPLAYKFSRRPSHLQHPPHNKNQRILSSKKLEDSLLSLKSYLGRSLDDFDEVPPPLLTRRRAKHDKESARQKYARDKTDEEFKKHWSQRPHTNTPTQGEGKMTVSFSDENEDMNVDEDENCMDGKSTSRQSRDTGFYSMSHGDGNSFVLGPRDWTPVKSQTPREEEPCPQQPTVDIKKMVDKGSDVDDDSSVDDGLDGGGIVVGLAQGSDDSDVDIIYSTGSHIEVPDNTLDLVEGIHSNDISVQTHTSKSVSPDNDKSFKHENQIYGQEVNSAIVSQSINSNQTIGQISNQNNSSDFNENLLNSSGAHTNNNVLATSCDLTETCDTDLIASDGESVAELIDDVETKIETNVDSNQIETVQRPSTSAASRRHTPGSASSQKLSRSMTPSSMHSTFAQDDDKSSVTILPHDQDLISVDVRSSMNISDQFTAQENASQTTDSYAPNSEAQVKDTESVYTGDDALSVSMSMGEDTTSVIQQLRDLHEDYGEEGRDKLGEIIDPKFPRDDRGRIEMIDSEELNLSFTKTSTPFLPPTPSENASENITPRTFSSPIKDTNNDQSANDIDLDSSQRSLKRQKGDISSSKEEQQHLNQGQISKSDILKELDGNTVEPLPSEIVSIHEEIADRIVKSHLEENSNISIGTKDQSLNLNSSIDSASRLSEKDSPNLVLRDNVSPDPTNSRAESRLSANGSFKSVSQSINYQDLANIRPDSQLSVQSGRSILSNLSTENVLVKGDNSTSHLNSSKEIPHPTTPRSTEIATEDKLSPRPKSESSSKLGEKLEDEVGPETLISVTKKSEFPIIPDYLKPKPQPKSQLRKDQKKKVQKGKKTPIRVPTGKTDKPKATPTEKQEDEITQIIKKKVTLPPENEYSVIPDFVGEALQRSKERSKQQLEQEFKEKQDMIGQELSDTLFEGHEGMTAEELELAKKALREREETAREKLKDKTLKKPDDKLRKSTAGSSSVKSKKGKGGMANIAKDTLQQEKERLKMLKEQEKQQRLLEIKAIEDRIAASSDSRSTEEKKFKDKLQEVQMELERIEREAEMADQTEQDVRAALREDRLRRMEEKARQKKEELARKKQQQFEKRMLEKQKKEEAKAEEKRKIMMTENENERKKKEEELQKRLLLEEEEEEKRRKEEEEDDERRRREEEELIWQREEEAEQESMKRILEEQDELRRKQEMMAAEKEKLLEEQRRRKELQALEEQRQREELERIKMEEIRKMQEEKARIHELQKLEEDVRENMRQEMERRKNEALMRREYNLEAKSNLNKMKHSQGITRAWVWSYFIDWPIETYLRPIGEAEKKKKEAKLREKRKKAR